MDAQDELKQISLLYVEDDENIRKQVTHFLQRKVGRLWVANDGRQGLEYFMAHKPDIVLSDIMMPGMNGLDMVRAIRKEFPDTPAILSTAFSDAAYLLEAIKLRIDNYVLKPVDFDELFATIRKNANLLLARRELAAKNAELELYWHHAEEERQLVAGLMKRMMRPETLRDVELRYHIKQAEKVGGDLIAAQRYRNKLYIMLADSTGHGLAAALNLLPVNHIFHSMAGKGAPLSAIVEDMNCAVKQQSPANRFVAALVARIDTRNRLVEVWNGGIPPAFFVSEDGMWEHRFDSANLPLGILDDTFEAETEIIQWPQAGQLLAFSDGLEEAENSQGTQFGFDRVHELITAFPHEKRFDALVENVYRHVEPGSFRDDVSLLLVNCGIKRD
ncbi:MAG: SpoIIE family protein phosphatase [Sulfuricellaceae bacterium]